MCKKVKYCNSRIDKCMRNIIGFINRNTNYSTYACCCGHGKYPMTIIVGMDIDDNKIRIELISNKLIPRTRNFYKRDKQGYYYIPEVSNEINEINTFFKKIIKDR